MTLVKRGKVRAEKLPNGQYIYNDDDVYAGIKRKTMNIVYARVSTQKQKNDLANQIALLERFCAAKGVIIHRTLSDVASGISFDKRTGFFALLDLVLDNQVSKVFITYKDRLSRVGFALFKHLFAKYGTEIVVINESNNEKLDGEEIFEEIISLLHCFSMRHYSQRKVKKIKEILHEQEETTKETEENRTADQNTQNETAPSS